MISQGFPLYAERISDGTWWIVVGWRERADGMAPYLVPVDANTGRACLQSEARFEFTRSWPPPASRMESK